MSGGSGRNSPDARGPLNPRPDHQLLQRVANGERSFGLERVDDPTTGAEFDRLVEALQGLQASGLVADFRYTRNTMGSASRWYRAGGGDITERGRRALAAWARRASR